MAKRVTRERAAQILGVKTKKQPKCSDCADEHRPITPRCPRYNGWTNYETWNVALWMSNDEGSESYWSDQASECWDRAEADKTFTREERAALDLSDIMKREHEDAEADILERAGVVGSMWADLLGAALSEVNWYEIAEHYIADCDKDENTEGDNG